MMIPVKDIPDDIAVIQSQIEERLRMSSTLTGWLYPSILQGEIDSLKDRVWRLKYGVKP